MRRRSLRGATVGGLLIGLAACNALVGLDGDYDLADGDAGPGASSDATSSSSSGDATTSSSSSGTTPIDAGVDATDADADASVEAGADAGADADADSGPPPTYCAPNLVLPNTKFCWDFTGDESPPTYGWSEVFKMGTSPVVSVEGDVGTAGRRLRAKASSGGGDPGPGALLLWNLTNVTELPDGKTLKLTFDFVVANGSNSYAVLGAIQVGEPNRIEYGLAINSCGGGKVCAQENDRDDKPTAGTKPQLTLDTVHHGVVTLTRSGNTVGGSVAVDGTTLNTRSSNAEPNGTVKTVRLVVGSGFLGTNGTSVTTFIDNVLVTVE